jgi:putative DNA primase/helicase
MILLSASFDWYRDCFLNNNSLDIYKNDNGQYNFSATLASKVLLPLVLPYYRYEPQSNVWYRFNDTHFEESKQLFIDIQDSLNDLKLRCEQAKQYFTSLTKIHADRFVPTVIEILQKSYTTHVTLEQFDSDPQLLNTPDGVFDLLSGESYPNNSSYLMRQIASVAPEDDQDGVLCPHYMKHLEFMTGGDKNLQLWLEKISGYMLTGSTFLQHFYWFYGLQNNGKSSLAGIWMHILHNYAHIAPQGQFAHNYFDPHPEQMLRLAGKRLVLTEELKGNRWDEAKIKSLMSGNPVAAREMFGKTVNFKPVCKLLFISNHKPIVDPNDGGIVRRLKMMPFIKQITPDMRIKDFEKKCLEPEAPYILNRMMRHAKIVLMEQAISDPPYVELETRQYFASNNWCEQFVEDACETGTACIESNKHLLTGCQLWAADAGQEPPNARSLGHKLEQLGFQSFSTNGMRGRKGIQLNEHYRSKVKFS